GEQALGPEGDHAAPAAQARRPPARPGRLLPRPLGPPRTLHRVSPARLRGPPLAASARPPRPRPPIGGPMLTVDYPGGTASIDADPTDHIGAHYAQGRWYEQDLLDDARARVHGPGLAVDVGAHIGGHSLWFTLACGLDVIALEPNPDTYQRLTNTVDANPGNIRAVQAAAGAHLSTASIAVTRRGNTGATRLAIGDGPIQVITLDSLDLQDVKLIKVDVEGMADQVLAGAARLIDEQSPVIYAEGDQDQIASMLPAGYRCAGQLCRTPTFVFTRKERPPLRLSAAIMAHPTRKDQVEELQAMLDRDVPVAWD